MLGTATVMGSVFLAGAQAPEAFAQNSNPLAQALNPAGPNNTGPQTNNALPQPDAAQQGAQATAPDNRRNFGINNAQSQRQAQLEAEKRAEQARKEREEKIRKQAFDAALNGLMPLKPDEIREVLRQYDKTREAIETPFYPHPKPQVSVVPVSLDPGAEPPVLQLATGYVTTVSILDSTGEPWPIEDISWAGDFQFTQTESGGHILRITPLSEFAFGNLSMRLIGLKTPVTITMKTQKEVAQYRVDVRVPLTGPNARPAIIDGPGLQAGSAVMTAILDGTPPPSVEKLKVTGVDGRTTAYRLNGMVYLRTPLTLLSPGWASSARSGDGTSVFVMNDTPVVLLSDQGQMKRAHLKVDKDEELL